MTKTVNDPHVAELMGRLFEQMTGIFVDPSWDGVRVSHVRILETVEPDGSRLTDVARQLRMTKQGAGQLVATLVDHGLVEQRPDPEDRRAKVLVRTAGGDGVVRRVHGELAALERTWSREVGAEEYVVFRTVLEALSGARTAGA